MAFRPPNAGAHLSKCQRYRFALWRIWDPSLPYVLFIGLNPSTADASNDDPTLVRCRNFARDWGYGGVVMANLFAWRATQPADMLAATHPVGRGNNAWLKKLSGQAGIVIAAWGNDGNHLQRAGKVRALLPEMYCLKLNKSGQPAHPLYLKASLKPVRLSSGS